MATLVGTMETMHAAGRRNLPPVPRSSTEAIPPAADAPVVAPVLVDATIQADAGQAFVARLRAAAPAFATAAGADSAVVREVVPPARHRRSRCRVVLRQADGTETDLTFVGERHRADAAGPDLFEGQISEWLRAGRPRDRAWLTDDPEAHDGLAVDVTAWAATA